MTENLRALSDAFAQTPPNALELHLAEQNQPGYIPEGDLGRYAFSAVLRGLKVTDPAKYQRIRYAQINNLGDEAITAILRGEA